MRKLSVTYFAKGIMKYVKGIFAEASLVYTPSFLAGVCVKYASHCHNKVERYPDNGTEILAR